jgi:hypothetical protein
VLKDVPTVPLGSDVVVIANEPEEPTGVFNVMYTE